MGFKDFYQEFSKENETLQEADLFTADMIGKIVGVHLVLEGGEHHGKWSVKMGSKF